MKHFLKENSPESWDICTDKTMPKPIWFPTYKRCVGMVNVPSFWTLLFLFSNKMLVIRISNSQNDFDNGQQGRPSSACFFKKNLIWVCTVCLSLFGRQLHVVFEILEHLLYVVCYFHIHEANVRLKTLRNKPVLIFYSQIHHVLSAR